jgi:hypothetical protein
MSDKFLHKDLESYLATKNNLCCYYCNTGMVRNSKNIMSDISNINELKLISHLYDANTPYIPYSEAANDLSNICVFENKLKNYSESLISGMQSLALNQLSKISETFFNNKNKNEQQREENNKSMNITDKVLALSYYNIGVQQEFLERNSDCKLSFDKATEISSRSQSVNFLKGKKLTTSNNSYNSTFHTFVPKKGIRARNRSMSCSSNFGIAVDEEGIVSEIK